MRPIFYGTVIDGRLALEKKDKFNAFLSKIKGAVQLEIKRPQQTRSTAENRYYWGVIVKMVGDEIGIVPDEAHELLKGLFLKTGIEHNGKRFEILRSTADLSIASFEAYCEKCRQWAANEINCVIPLPNEVIFDD